MLGHQVYFLKVGTNGISVLLTTVNTDFCYLFKTLLKYIWDLKKKEIKI